MILYNIITIIFFIIMCYIGYRTFSKVGNPTIRLKKYNTKVRFLYILPFSAKWINLVDVSDLEELKKYKKTLTYFFVSLIALLLCFFTISIFLIKYGNEIKLN